MHFFQDFSEILPRTCKVMLYSYIILKNPSQQLEKFWQIRRFLQDTYKILVRITLSVGFLQDLHHLQESFKIIVFCKNLQVPCKICISVHLGKQNIERVFNLGEMRTRNFTFFRSEQDSEFYRFYISQSLRKLSHSKRVPLIFFKRKSEKKI